MSAILAIFNRNGAPVDVAAVRRMTDVCSARGVDGEDLWVGDSVALVHQHFWMTPEEHGERQPIRDAAGRRILSADARIDNRPALISRLGLESSKDDPLSDAALILLAYERWGVECVKHIEGEFAFALWDCDEHSLFIARDPLGARGLSYYCDRELFLAASEIRQLLAHPQITPAINEGRVADFLAGHWHNQDETYYQDIFYCPPAHCLLVTADGIKKWRYWGIDAGRRIRYQQDSDYAEHFLELLTEAVRCRLRTFGAVGISLSGGLDSGTLAAMAGELLPEMGLPQERLFSFSYVFNELAGVDERHYIQPMVDRYQLQAAYIACDDMWTLRDLHEWPVSESFVLADPYPRLSQAVMAAAQEKGCRLLLAGYYGDVLFTGQQFWAAAMLRDRRLAELAGVMLSERAELDLRRDLFENGIRQLLPERLRSQYRRRRPRSAQALHPGLHPQMAELADSRAQPNEVAGPEKGFAADRLHHYRALSLNLFAQGASEVRIWYNSHGMELAMPFWDRRLVEFAVAIPADKLGRLGRDRWLLRSALSGRLPDVIRERSGRTVFLPLFERGLLEEERETVPGILTDALIVQRRYVRADWLNQQLLNGAGWSDDDQRFFLWRCLSLELWLKLLDSKCVMLEGEGEPYEER